MDPIEDLKKKRTIAQREFSKRANKINDNLDLLSGDELCSEQIGLQKAYDVFWGLHDDYRDIMESDTDTDHQKEIDDLNVKGDSCRQKYRDTLAQIKDVVWRDLASGPFEKSKLRLESELDKAKGLAQGEIASRHCEEMCQLLDTSLTDLDAIVNKWFPFVPRQEGAAMKESVKDFDRELKVHYRALKRQVRRAAGHEEQLAAGRKQLDAAGHEDAAGREEQLAAGREQLDAAGREQQFAAGREQLDDAGREEEFAAGREQQHESSTNEGGVLDTSSIDGGASADAGKESSSSLDGGPAVTSEVRQGELERGAAGSDLHRAARVEWQPSLAEADIDHLVVNQDTEMELLRGHPRILPGNGGDTIPLVPCGRTGYIGCHQGEESPHAGHGGFHPKLEVGFGHSGRLDFGERGREAVLSPSQIQAELDFTMDEVVGKTPDPGGGVSPVFVRRGWNVPVRNVGGLAPLDKGGGSARQNVASWRGRACADPEGPGQGGWACNRLVVPVED